MGLVALAMTFRALFFWGPLNLVVLAIFLSFSACALALIPIIPHRPFWTGFGIFAMLYFGVYVLATDGAWREHLPTEKALRTFAVSRYGPRPDFKATQANGLTEAKWKRLVDDAVLGGHAVVALTMGLMGGTGILTHSRARESRGWKRDALTEHRLKDFLKPSLKFDPPANSK